MLTKGDEQKVWGVSGYMFIREMCFSIFWALLYIGFFIWAFVTYANQIATADWRFNMPKDIVGCVASSSMGLLLVSLFLLMAANLHKQYVKVIVEKDATTIKSLTSHYTFSSSVETVQYKGLNALATGEVRYAVLSLFAILWLNFPVFLAAIAFQWDRAKDEPVDDYHISDTQRYFVLFNGIVLFLSGFIFIFYNVGSLDQIFLSKAYAKQFYIEADTRPYDGGAKFSSIFKRYPDYFRYGFASDVLGTRCPLKGQVPVFFMPVLYINARALFTYAAAFTITNDFVQSTIIFLVCALTPKVLSLIGENPQLFAVYEASCWAWFYIVVYWVQGYMEPFNVNFNVMTVAQSALFPGMTLTTDFMGTSIALVYGLSFAMGCVSLLSNFIYYPVLDLESN